MSRELPFDRPLCWPEEWAWSIEPPPGHGDRRDRALATLTHLPLLPLALPLVVVLGRGHRSPYASHQAMEALNFQITALLAVLLCSLLTAVPLLLIVALGAAALSVRAAAASHRGAWHRYPLTLRFLT